jgi:outer membrane immunogenic protein
LTKRIMALSALALVASISAASASPANNFSGFYIGAHAGYGWENVDYTGPNASLSFDPDGFVGGAYGGYNWQWDGWIAGLEGNFDFVDGDETDTFGQPDTFEANWEGAVRARVGAFVGDDFLIYGAVGISWLDYDWTKNGTTVGDTTTGWTWSAGIEKQITSSLRARVEYRAGEYDDEHLSFPGSDRDVDPDTQAVTLGLAWALN